MTATFRTSAAGGNTTNVTTAPVTLVVKAGDHIVVAYNASGNTNAAPTMADDHGGTYSLIGTSLWNTSTCMGGVFVRDQPVPAADSSASYIITVTTGSQTACELVAVATQGMMRFGSSSIRSKGFQADQATSTTPTPVLNQAALTANPTICGVWSGDTTTSPNASWTERNDVSQSTPTTALEVATRDSGFTGTSIAFGATQATTFGSFAIELDSSNPLVGSWPASATALGTALGFGTWTDVLLCDDASGGLAAASGTSWTAGGTPTYSQPGALASGDSSIKFTASTTDTATRSPTVGANDFAWLFACNNVVGGANSPNLFENVGGLTASVAVSGTSFRLAFDGAVPSIVAGDLTVYAFVVAVVRDMSTSKVRIGVLNLNTGDVHVSAESVAGGANYTGTYKLCCDDGGLNSSSWNCSYAAFAYGSGTATGLSANLATALANLYTSVKKTTRSIAASANARTAATLTVGVSADAKVKTTRTVTSSADAKIKTTVTATASADAVTTIAAIHPTITASADAKVKTSRSATASADSRIALTRSISANADAKVKTTVAISAGADAKVQTTRTVSASADAKVQSTRTATVSADSKIQTSRSATSTADAKVQTSRSATSSADAKVQRTAITVTTVADASVAKTNTINAAANAKIQTSASVVANADAKVQSTRSISGSADASVALTRSASASANAKVQVAVALLVGADADIRATRALTSTFDASVALSRATTANADAKIQRSASVQSSADAEIQSTAAISANADAKVQASRQIVSATDADVQAARSISGSADADVRAERSVAAAGDAKVLAGGSIASVVDASVAETKTLASAADAKVQTAEAVSTSADADVRAVESISSIADASIASTRSANANANAVIQTGRFAIASADADIRSTRSISSAADAVMQATADITASFDAEVITAFSIGSAADARVQDTVSIASAVDAKIRTPRSLTVSADAVIQCHEAAVLSALDPARVSAAVAELLADRASPTVQISQVRAALLALRSGV